MNDIVTYRMEGSDFQTKRTPVNMPDGEVFYPGDIQAIILDLKRRGLISAVYDRNRDSFFPVGKEVLIEKSNDAYKVEIR